MHDEFAQKLQATMEKVKVGDGLDDGTTMGPCINRSQADFAQTHVDDAVSKGAKVRSVVCLNACFCFLLECQRAVLQGVQHMCFWDNYVMWTSQY